MSNPTNRTLTIRKTFNVPIEAVWEAWTTAEHIAQWWSPPGMKLAVEKHDFRVGGTWRFSTPMPDGTPFVSEGKYLVIEPMKRIVTTADFKPMTEGVELHVVFEKAGKGTAFTFSVLHPTEEYCKQQEKMGFYNGWGSAFKRLEGILNP